MKAFGPVVLACLVTMVIQTSARADMESERCYPSCLEGVFNSKQRRAIVDKMAMKLGQDAVDKLTRGGYHILDGNKKVQVYKKYGTYQTAIQEFKTVNPVSVTKFGLQGKNKGRIGTVGDRTIFLMKQGIAGRPTIRIMQHGSSESTERIVYMLD